MLVVALLLPIAAWCLYLMLRDPAELGIDYSRRPVQPPKMDISR